MEDVLKDHKQQQKVCPSGSLRVHQELNWPVAFLGQGEEGVQVGAVWDDGRRVARGSAEAVCSEPCHF